jgi:hypothetical protein
MTQKYDNLANGTRAPVALSKTNQRITALSLFATYSFTASLAPLAGEWDQRRDAEGLPLLFRGGKGGSGVLPSARGVAGS